MLIGYARVSKADGSQLLDLQRGALIGAGVEEERIYQDRASGRHDHRPGLEASLKALQPGNTFVVWKLDRLGRNLKHLVTTVEELHDRGIGLRVLAGAEIDTATANGRLGTRPRCAWRCEPWRIGTPLHRTWPSASASPRRPCTCTLTTTAR
jgi:DNA invertase Pin-like site-specific DNA recombinase